MSKSILVVEDDRYIRETMAEFLESEGYDVRTAENGKVALDILSSQAHPAAILLDLMMPVMDGSKFREEQEKDPSIANIPVILMSATSHIDSSKHRLGAVAAVSKPVDIDELSNLIKRL